ncbi:MAG: hypothetical protein U0638_04600 [Phycisphaerales bacterium]
MARPRRLGFAATGVIVGLVCIMVVRSLMVTRHHALVGPVDVVWGSEYTLSSLISRCEQPRSFIEIGGLKYWDVTGVAPHCVFVPEANKIVFSRCDITKPEDPTICLYDIPSGWVDRVPTGRVFGFCIAGDPNGPPQLRDQIVRATDQEIEVQTVWQDEEARFVIDLHSLKFARVR